MTEVMVSKTEMQTVGDVPVEIFWILTEDGAEIAVSHIQTEHPVVAVSSVILLHGT
ncbi:MAG: hypothetical protein JRF40_01910, partial [Deltaproteobacteria bacterium]|nr:hypothetical protein [Deltaproteobacteria bacterium]